MLNADSRDYKHICAHFGVEDVDLVVMKVEAKKKERQQNMGLVGKFVMLHNFIEGILLPAGFTHFTG